MTAINANTKALKAKFYNNSKETGIFRLRYTYELSFKFWSELNK